MNFKFSFEDVAPAPPEDVLARLAKASNQIEELNKRHATAIAESRFRDVSAIAAEIGHWKSLAASLSVRREILPSARLELRKGGKIELPLSIIKPSQSGTLSWDRQRLFLVTDNRQYAFSSYAKLVLPPSFDGVTVCIEASLEVLTGELGIGWFDSDRGEWLSRRMSGLGKEVLNLLFQYTPNGQLVFDNCFASGPTSAFIEKISISDTG